MAEDLLMETQTADPLRDLVDLTQHNIKGDKHFRLRVVTLLRPSQRSP
jgi:hypothetical protein